MCSRPGTGGHFLFLSFFGWLMCVSSTQLAFAHPADASGILACSNKANVNPDESS